MYYFKFKLGLEIPQPLNYARSGDSVGNTNEECWDHQEGARIPPGYHQDTTRSPPGINSKGPAKRKQDTRWLTVLSVSHNYVSCIYISRMYVVV